jgi:hypothetical protein
MITLLLLVSLSMNARSEGFRLLSSTGRSVSFEIDVPRAELITGDDGLVRLRIDGYGTFSPPGAYELPGNSFRVAVPPSGEPRVTFNLLETEQLGRFELARVFGERFVEDDEGMFRTERFMPPDPWADGYLPPVVSAGRRAFMGRQRVLAVRVNPVLLRGGEVSIARRILVTVDFGVERPGEAEGLKSPEMSGAWNRLYEDLLVNPADVELLRRPLVERSVPLTELQAGARLKLHIPDTGIYAVRADSLIDEGLSQGLSTDMIALKKYYFDDAEPSLRREENIPAFVIEDGLGATGIFDGGDMIVFYAMGIKDDIEAGDPTALFTHDNVVWLEEEVAGELMTEDIASQAGAEAPLADFVARTRLNRDIYYLKRAVPGSRDFYFITKQATNEASVPFTVHNPASSGTFTVVMGVQGVDNLNTGVDVTVAVRNATGTHALGTRGISFKSTLTYNFVDNPVEWLVDGENELVIFCSKSYVYVLDYVTITYDALYEAHDDRLEFTVGESAVDRRVDITGFSVNSGTLIEITDPSNPVHYELTSDLFSAAPAPYTLSLRMEAGNERRFVAVGEGAFGQFRIADVRKDTASDLAARPGPFNTLIVSHRDFLPYLTGYTSWREEQGYRILTADVEDVYDEFNGGLPSSEAIKRLVRYGVDHWGVEFVLLVGDASEDHKRTRLPVSPLQQGSGPDLVPTYTYCVEVSGTYVDEVVSSDSWYAFLDPGEVPVSVGAVESAAGGSEGEVQASIQQEFGYPDVFVGRFPVGRDVEIRALINKITKFENTVIEDTWRRRIVLVSDDAWSGVGDDYKYNSYEREFAYSMGRVAADIEGSLPGGFEIHGLDLADWTDGAHEIGEYGAGVYSEALDSTRTFFVPNMLRKLNRGALLFTFQGHANRAALAKEAVFATMGQYEDQDSLRSQLPLVFIGVGCHISDFAIVAELNELFDGPNGDCLSEQILFKSGSGAVGTFASSAFEYLSQNAVFCERLHEVMFQDPPVDSIPPDKVSTGAHWVLAEVVTKAEIEHLDATTYGMNQILRYVILGDPMLRIDPGPPLMKLEIDWGEGFIEIDPDSFYARNGTNDCSIRFTASDVVALGGVRLEVSGENWTDSLTVTPLRDEDLTFARGYSAEMDYTMTLGDGSLRYTALTPEGGEAGILEFPFVTELRFFYNGDFEITPGVQSPPTGTFTLRTRFPAYPDQAPVLLIDGLEQGDILFTVPDPQDSLSWEASFDRTFSAGSHLLTLRVGEFEKDFPFQVTGSGLVLDGFSFPNPFDEGTNIVYALNLSVDSGRIEIYNVSGRLIRSFDIPLDKLGAATFANPHSVYWDGRDMAGDLVANGTYLYIIMVERNGEKVDLTGKSVRLR